MKKIAPVAYFGGKGNLKTKLLPLIPYTKAYAEPFGGGASVLFARDPSPVEWYNDLNDSLVGLFRVLQDPERYQVLQHKLAHTLYSRSEFDKACQILSEQTVNPIERAWAFYVAQNQGFSGLVVKRSWGRSLSSSARGMASTTSRWGTRLNYFQQWYERISRVQIESRDALELIEYLNEPDTTLYVDPPYPQATRKSGGYIHEMSDDRHDRLVELLCKFKGNTVVSTYPSDLYAPLERHGYQKIEFQTSCYAAGRTRASGISGVGGASRKVPRTEVVSS